VNCFLPELSVANTMLKILYKVAPIVITAYAGYGLGESTGIAIAESQHPNLDRVIAGIWQREVMWIGEKIVRANLFLAQKERDLQQADATTRETIRLDIAQVSEFIQYYGTLLQRVNDLMSDILLMNPMESSLG
jgi:hypothetical protein